MKKLYDDIPLLTISVKTMKFFGYLQFEGIRYYLGIIIFLAVTLICLTEATYFNNLNNKKITTIMVQFVITGWWFNVIVRTCNLVVKRHSFEDLLQRSAEFYLDLEKNGDEYLKMELKRRTRLARLLSKILLGLTIAAGTNLNILPLTSTPRGVPFDFHIPGFDQYKMPNFVFVYIVEGIVISPIYGILYISITNFYFTIAYFIPLLQLFVQHKLYFAFCFKNQSNKKTVQDEHEVYEKLIDCIKYHENVLSYTRLFNNCITHMLLFEIGNFTALLCALLLFLHFAENAKQVIQLFSLAALLMSQIFLTCYFMHNIMIEGHKIGDIAYEMPWYRYSVRIQKIILMIIHKSQLTPYIYMGNLYPFTLELFCQLINRSYAAFTILRRVF